MDKTVGSISAAPLGPRESAGSIFSRKAAFPKFVNYSQFILLDANDVLINYYHYYH